VDAGVELVHGDVLAFGGLVNAAPVGRLQVALTRRDLLETLLGLANVLHRCCLAECLLCRLTLLLTPRHRGVARVPIPGLVELRVLLDHLVLVLLLQRVGPLRELPIVIGVLLCRDFGVSNGRQP
jgi:hypothetical protein